MTNYGDKVWEPSEERVRASAMYQFQEFVQKELGLKFTSYADLHRWSIEDSGAFWFYAARFLGIKWQSAPAEGKFHTASGSQMLGVRWFPGAKLNFAENLLPPDSDAVVMQSYCEGRPGFREITARDLRRKVAQCAAALKKAGVARGDRVAGMLANVPEAVIAMLATASLGAVWSSCSADFGSLAIVDRFGQIAPKVFLFTPQYYYGGKSIDTAPVVKEALKKLPSVVKAIAVPHLVDSPSEWHEFLATGGDEPLSFAPCNFGDAGFILYSSGTTGVPKCIVHSYGGTLLQHMKELRLHSDSGDRDAMLFFTTCGWMMWNWMVSALAVGTKLVLFDGSPGIPDLSRLWQIVDEAGVTILGTSPKFIQSQREVGAEPGKAHSLQSLRTVLSTGSPLLPEHFDWIYRHVKADVHLASISGGTDIISCFMLGNPMLPVYAGEIQVPGLGMDISADSDDGKPLAAGEKGELVCTKPFPSMPVGFWNDPDGKKYHKAYFEYFGGKEIWRHGDFVSFTEHGGIIVYGRSDSTLNPGGIRIGTAEIYRVLECIPHIADAVAVSDTSHRGNAAVILFLKMEWGRELTDDLLQTIRTKIRTSLSPRHVPSEIVAVPDIPYTKNGKKVELAVHATLEGHEVRNDSALVNPESLRFFVKWAKNRRAAAEEAALEAEKVK